MFEGYNDYLAYTQDCAKDVCSHEEQMALLEEYRANGDTEASHGFAKAQMLWVAQSLCKRYRNSGHLMDLIQDANVRLLELVESFDPTVGVKFRTYAEPVLLKEAATNLMKYQSGRESKTSVFKRSYHYRKVFDAFVDKGMNRQDALWATARVYQAEQRKRAFDDLSEDKKQATYVHVMSLIALTSADVSLDAPMGEEGDYTLSDQIADEEHGNPEALQLADEEIRLLYEAVMALPERYRFVLVRSHGLFGYSKLRTVEIAELLGVTRQRVSDIKIAAEEKVKQYMIGRS